MEYFKPLKSFLLWLNLFGRAPSRFDFNWRQAFKVLNCYCCNFLKWFLEKVNLYFALVVLDNFLGCFILNRKHTALFLFHFIIKHVQYRSCKYNTYVFFQRTVTATSICPGKHEKCFSSNNVVSLTLLKRMFHY